MKYPTMKHPTLKLYRYTIPLRKPFHVAKGEISEREGFVLGDGHDIWSEIAPLPGFSSESTEDAGTFLTENAKRIHSAYRDRSLDQLLLDDAMQPELSRLPSVRFGLSMLSEQQKARTAEQPLYVYWKNLYYSPRSRRNRIVPVEGYVRCNALAGIMDIKSLHQLIRYRKECGFRTVKVKIPADPDDAFEIIQEICPAFPEMVFRFDANRAFSLSEAEHLFQQMQNAQTRGDLPGNIAYIEEPLADPDPGSLSQLQACGIPVAADESVRSPADIQQLESGNSVKQLIIKPMLFGSFPELETAFRSKLAVTISSSIETAIGRRLLAHIAVLYNMKGMIDHGLDTGSLLQMDFTSPESGPHIRLGNKTGLGFTPDSSHDWMVPVREF
ncbi:MAG: o-succinylbenzoate synthase [Balneolaceae bacterium]|nr:MAG: o-succinylbenzoate synthase [Balneolaceae bacterium]